MNQLREPKPRPNPVRVIIYLGILLGVLVPMVPQLIWAFSHRWLYPSVVPSEWSWRAWEYITNPNTRVLSSALTSLWIALTVTAISILVGVPAGKALGMYRFRGRGVVELIILSPSIIPSLAVTMGMQVIFIRMGLSDTALGVIIVHLIPTIPYMTISMAGVFANYDPAYEDQARSLGANSLRTFFLITVPAVAPGIVTGGMFAFLISWGQYILTVIIGGGRVITLPLLLFSFAGSGDFPVTSAMSIIFLLPSIVILVFTSKYLSGRFGATGGF